MRPRMSSCVLLAATILQTGAAIGFGGLAGWRGSAQDVARERRIVGVGVSRRRALRRGSLAGATARLRAFSGSRHRRIHTGTKNHTGATRGANATQSPPRRGVILWAHGRSATDTFCDSLQRSAHLPYCRNIKEGFNRMHSRGKRLTRDRLARCAAKGQMLTHSKPGHLDAGGLGTPEALFRAAREVGFGVVVAEYRRNALVRSVSSFEMHPHTAAEAESQYCRKPGALVARFEGERTLYERGVAAAKAERLKVIEFTFLDLISAGGICTCVKRATAALEKEQCGESKCKCRKAGEDNPHTRTSHRGKPLAKRTSPGAAKCITAALAGDPRYAWMLDLSRLEPPGNATRGKPRCASNAPS